MDFGLPIAFRGSISLRHTRIRADIAMKWVSKLGFVETLRSLDLPRHDGKGAMAYKATLALLWLSFVVVIVLAAAVDAYYISTYANFERQTGSYS